MLALPLILKTKTMETRTVTYNNRQFTLDEIKRKLEWFHGEEFSKYPFIENAEF